MFQCKILADSLATNGSRLTTMEVTYPRAIHSEIMTHREFSKNAASSRAIPVSKMIDRISNDPFIPLHWGMNQTGMVAEQEIDKSLHDKAVEIWLKARDNALNSAKELMDLGVHKQITNRLVEPFMWITIIISSTNWKHLFRLRCSPDAEPHFQKIAGMMKNSLENSIPVLKQEGEWHLPLIQEEERNLDIDLLIKLSTARCGRVSYLSHDGKRDLEKDIELYNRLRESGHFSPFEHIARAMPKNILEKSGNFTGWIQHRKDLANEHLV